MPISDKQQDFVNNYCTNGYNATQAYKDAYPNCKGGWDKLGPRLTGNDGVKQAISEHKVKNKAKIEHNKELALSKLQQVIDNMTERAVKDGNISANRAIIAAIAEMNNITGLHQQKIITETDQQRELNQAQEQAAAELAAELNRQAIRKSNAG